MKYFSSKNSRHQALRYAASILLVIAALTVFGYGINQLNASSEKEQIQILDHALSKSITECYALEGTYPPDISYLKDHYGLTYDESSYRIDYTYIGANLRPNYTIVVLSQ